MSVIAFIGPSIRRDVARGIIDADYRRPIRRGDLATVAPGSVVAIIDGVFEQSLSVSPREVLAAVARGVVVFGGASMGALRAVEVPGVLGVGRVYEWYRDEVIDRDDEVALLFDGDTGRALTVPMVNVRFAVERLSRPGTIDRDTAERLIAAALELPYERRRYPTILKVAGLSDRADADALISMLKAHDLKLQDAQAVLEAVDRYVRRGQTLSGDAGAGRRGADREPAQDTAPRPRGDRELLIWESGDRVRHDELWRFLLFTGALEGHLRAVLSRAALAGELPTVEVEVTHLKAQSIFNRCAGRWGWLSSEEATVTLADLELGVDKLGEVCAKEARARAVVSAHARDRSDELRADLLGELFLSDLALKRECMRAGALRALANMAQRPASEEERSTARAVLCRAHGVLEPNALRRRWATMGASDRGEQEDFVECLALARQSAREIVLAMSGRRPSVTHGPHTGALGLGPCPKPPGETRFSLPLDGVEAHVRRLRQTIGITRVGMIGELGDLGGVQIAQAARPGSAWSSSYGSGKSRTREGAVVGSVMEEAEKWAQERFQPHQRDLPVGSFERLRRDGRFLDPATLDLPYDSVYRPNAPLCWFPCIDLLRGGEIYVPLDALQMVRRPHDICFTPRGARKHFATNGLGAGFRLEEAVLHALCEYVERHAQRLAELTLVNPGGAPGAHAYRFVELSTASPRVADLAAALGRHGWTVRVLDITSDVAIPTFMAGITREMRRADGYGTHPDPETAIEMALLEAAQTISSAAAGGREDLSIHARSLGRHERPRPVALNDVWMWLDPDPLTKPVEDIRGFVCDDIFEELMWCLDRLRGAGLGHLPVLDLSVPEIEPARVVRVLVPGLETNNPFFTGPRARVTLLRDLLPNWR